MGTKSVGAATVLDFALQCVRRQAVVSEPIGDDAAYDLIVDANGVLHRVQVKGAYPNAKRPGFFTVNTQRRVPTAGSGGGLTSKAVAYNQGEVDCIVTVADGVWYFFDEPESMPASVEINPSNPPTTGKWNKFKDAWDTVGL